MKENSNTCDESPKGINKVYRIIRHKIELFFFVLFGGLKKPCKGEIEDRKVKKAILTCLAASLDARRARREALEE